MYECYTLYCTVLYDVCDFQMYFDSRTIQYTYTGTVLYVFVMCVLNNSLAKCFVCE